MAENVLERALQNLDDLGVFEYMLPFLLVFTVTFAILQKSKILGEDKKNFNVAFSTITALLFIYPHVTGKYHPDSDPVLILNAMIPDMGLVLVAVIFLMILLGVFGQDFVFLGAAAPAWVLLFSIGVVTYIFGSAANWWDGGFVDTLVDWFGADAISIAVMLLVFGAVVFFIASDPEKELKAGVDFNKLFGGK